ncbi:Rho GTPase activation protein [Xylariaceae sp. FL0594]|nr:Rho GTPase activation protein [Xylariaceae sp. FL0594]
MDSLPITESCDLLEKKIGSTLGALTRFVRHVREARSDADAVSRDLHSLQNVVVLLKEDAHAFPPELAEKTLSVTEHCSSVVDKLNDCLSVLISPNLPTQEKRMRWLDTARSEAAGYGTALEVNKAAIGLALDLVGLTTVRDSASDAESGELTMLEKRRMNNETLTDIARTLMQMDHLRNRLPSEADRTPTSFSLGEYMSYLKLYGETILRFKEMEFGGEARLTHPRQPISRQNVSRADSEQKGAFIGGEPNFGPYVGDEPDSAIDMNSVRFTSHSDDRVESFATDEEYAYPAAEDEYVFHEACPPIDEERLDDDECLSILEDYQDAEGSCPPFNPADIPSRAPTPPPRALKRLDTSRKTISTSSENGPDSPTIPYPYGFMTETSPTESKAAPSIASTKRRGLGRFFSPFKGSSISDGRPSMQSTTSTTSGSSEGRPKTPAAHESVTGHSSKRLSLSGMRLSSWKSQHVQDTGPATKAVFGVTLQRSMQVAKGSSKTHHGGGSGGSSRREFPLCMQKCSLFIKEQGARAPGIFAQSGDIFRVSKLKEMFSIGPTYGSDMDWTGYTVYDAADLMLLFLSQLPRPLVPESLVKRWISLTRQTAQSGSHAARLDGCIDFWEEAMSGLGGPSRSLFKLLLNLWADVAAAENETGMSAERLAGVVLKPLVHVEGSKHWTDYKLALGYLIRRRIEYIELLADNKSAVKRISRAAW